MDYYYRRLISLAGRKRALRDDHVHADTRTLLSNLENDGRPVFRSISSFTGNDSAGAGERVVVSSIAGHFCIDAFKARSPLLIDLLFEKVDEAVKLEEAER